MILGEGRPIPKTYGKVLLQIAKEGPQTKYEIETVTKVNHASVHEAIRYFLKVGELEGEKIGITRVGLPKTNYKLTFSGLCRALITAEKQDYDKIIHKWRHLEPLLLGKWEYLKEKVGKTEAELFFFRFGRLVLEIGPPDEEMIEVYREDIVMEILDPNPFLNANPDSDELDKLGKWVKVFQEDSDLKQRAIRCVTWRLRDSIKEVDWFRKLKRQILR
jgi:hypothetical protein